jgi:hypothetical protein
VLKPSLSAARGGPHRRLSRASPAVRYPRSLSHRYRYQPTAHDFQPSALEDPTPCILPATPESALGSCHRPA